MSLIIRRLLLHIYSMCPRSKVKFQTSDIKLFLVDKLFRIAPCFQLIFSIKRKIKKEGQSQTLIHQLYTNNMFLSWVNNFCILLIIKTFRFKKESLYQTSSLETKWKLKTKSQIQCKLLGLLKLSFYLEPKVKVKNNLFQSKIVLLCNQQADTVSSSLVPYLDEKPWTTWETLTSNSSKQYEQVQ